MPQLRDHLHRRADLSVATEGDRGGGGRDAPESRSTRGYPSIADLYKPELVTNDTLTGVLVATSAGQFSGVGTYAINQGSLANADYAITYTGADLSDHTEARSRWQPIFKARSTATSIRA